MSDSNTSAASFQGIRGIVPPMVTPLSDYDTLDTIGLERLVEHILAGGVHGLFVLGTTGEGPSLSARLRREVVDRVCKQVAGRVPVLVGISDTSFVESVDLANYSAQAGAAAVVVAPPSYFPLDQTELLAYLAHLAPSVPLPLVLYNMPTHTKINFDLDTLALAMEIPNIVGVKDSSGNMIYFQKLRKLIAERSTWNLLIGPEELLSQAVLLGGDGGVSGGANIHPQLYVSIYEAARDRDLDRVTQLQKQVEELSGRIYGVNRTPSAVIKGIKGALACLGICSPLVAEPLVTCSESECLTIDRHLHELGLRKE